MACYGMVWYGMVWYRMAANKIIQSYESYSRQDDDDDDMMIVDAPKVKSSAHPRPLTTCLGMDCVV